MMALSGNQASMGFLGKYHKLFTVCSNRDMTGSYTFKQAGAVDSSPEGYQPLTIAADKVWLWRIDDGELVWCSAVVPDGAAAAPTAGF
jgi:hypothetical protein